MCVCFAERSLVLFGGLGLVTGDSPYRCSRNMRALTCFSRFRFSRALFNFYSEVKSFSITPDSIASHAGSAVKWNAVSVLADFKTLINSLAMSVVTTSQSLRTYA